jgi:hypothetical protein
LNNIYDQGSNLLLFRRETKDEDTLEVEKAREEEEEVEMEQEEKQEEEVMEEEEEEEEENQGITVVHSMEVQNLIIQESQSFTLGKKKRLLLKKFRNRVS